jgi:hypothetical protein
MNVRHIPWVFTAFLVLLGLWVLVQTCSRPHIGKTHRSAIQSRAF